MPRIRRRKFPDAPKPLDAMRFTRGMRPKKIRELQLQRALRASLDVVVLPRKRPFGDERQGDLFNPKKEQGR